MPRPKKNRATTLQRVGVKDLAILKARAKQLGLSVPDYLSRLARQTPRVKIK